MIVVVGYGMGNVGALENMLRRNGASATISDRPDVIAKADGLVLPGVGSFDNAMRRLTQIGLIDVLNEAVIHRGVPILGVCLGMQLFTRRSEEGELPGFGWLQADTVRIRPVVAGERVRVPHMGWNRVDVVRQGHLVPDNPDTARFYYLHSYEVVCDRDIDVVATAPYGGGLVSMVEHENVVGVQFHPEKSHRFGFELMRKFSALRHAWLDRA